MTETYQNTSNGEEDIPEKISNELAEKTSVEDKNVESTVDLKDKSESDTKEGRIQNSKNDKSNKVWYYLGGLFLLTLLGLIARRLRKKQ